MVPHKERENMTAGFDPEEILVTHHGYTDTAYASCGIYKCNRAILLAVGVSGEDADNPMGSMPIETGVNADLVSLGESDSCEYCAACGDFIRHGLRYPGEDVGCTHDTDEWGDVIDPPHHGKPHIDLIGHPAMREFL